MISKVSDLENLIREVPDFPKPGIVYKDITPLLENSEALKFTIHSLAEMVKTLNIQKVIGIESRGFILGSALAVEIGAGLVLVRKAGKLPHQKIVHSYDLEYGSDQVEVHEDAVRPGERVLIVDDVLATGGTASACLELMKKLKADVLGSCFLIELKFLGARTRFSGLKVHSLLSYQ